MRQMKPAMFVWPILIGLALIIPSLLYINKVISLMTAIIVGLIIILPLLLVPWAHALLFRIPGASLYTHIP